MFAVRIVKVDHYVAPPTRGLDVCYSDFRNCQLTKVPIIRIFGPTPAGQKTCIHLHGTFPYIYIPYDGTEPTDQYMHQLAVKLDQALMANQSGADGGVHCVYKVELVSGIPFYGYHAKEHLFLKIYFLNPQIVERAVEILQSGAIMNRSFQPHEAHIPYILQVFIDYNLFGMDLIKCHHIKFRRKIGANPQESQNSSHNLSDSLPLFNDSADSLTDSLKLWDPDNASCSLKLDNVVVKQSICELEVDVLAADVLNSLDFAGSQMNPGIAAIWEDERKRRRQMNQLSQITPPCSQDRQPAASTKSELDYLEKIKLMLCTVNSQEQSSFAEESQAHARSGIESKSFVESEQSLNQFTHNKTAAAENSLLEIASPTNSQLSNKDSFLDDNDFRDILMELMETESVNSESSEHGRPSNSHPGAEEHEKDDEFAMSQVIQNEDLENFANQISPSILYSDASSIPQIDGPNDPKDDLEGSSNRTIVNNIAINELMSSTPKKLTRRSNDMENSRNCSEKLFVHKMGKMQFLSSSRQSYADECIVLTSDTISTASKTPSHEIEMDLRNCVVEISKLPVPRRRRSNSTPSAVQKQLTEIKRSNSSDNLLREQPKDFDEKLKRVDRLEKLQVCANTSFPSVIEANVITTDGLQEGNISDTNMLKKSDDSDKNASENASNKRGSRLSLALKVKSRLDSVVNEELRERPITANLRQILVGKSCDLKPKNTRIVRGRKNSPKAASNSTVQTRVKKRENLPQLGKRESRLSLRSGRKEPAQCKENADTSMIPQEENGNECQDSEIKDIVNEEPRNGARKVGRVWSNKSNIRKMSSRDLGRGGCHLKINLENDVPKLHGQELVYSLLAEEESLTNNSNEQRLRLSSSSDQSEQDEASVASDVISQDILTLKKNIGRGRGRGRGKGKGSNQQVNSAKEQPKEKNSICEDLTVVKELEIRNSFPDEHQQEELPTGCETVCGAPVILKRGRGRGRGRSRGRLKGSNTINSTLKEHVVIADPSAFLQDEENKHSESVLTPVETAATKKTVVRGSNRGRGRGRNRGRLISSLQQNGQAHVIGANCFVLQLDQDEACKEKESVSAESAKKTCIKRGYAICSRGKANNRRIGIAKELHKRQPDSQDLSDTNNVKENDASNWPEVRIRDTKVRVAPDVSSKELHQLGHEIVKILKLSKNEIENSSKSQLKISSKEVLVEAANSLLELENSSDATTGSQNREPASESNFLADIAISGNVAVVHQDGSAISLPDKDFSGSALAENLANVPPLSVVNKTDPIATLQSDHLPKDNVENASCSEESKDECNATVTNNQGSSCMEQDEKLADSDDTVVYDFDRRNENSQHSSDNDSDTLVFKRRGNPTRIDSNFELESDEQSDSEDSEPRGHIKSKQQKSRNKGIKRTAKKKKKTKRRRRRLVTPSESESDTRSTYYGEGSDSIGRITTKNLRQRKVICGNGINLDDFIVASSDNESSSSQNSVGNGRRRHRSRRKDSYYEDGDFSTNDDALRSYGCKKYSLRNKDEELNDLVVFARPMRRRARVDYAPNAYSSFFDPDGIGVEGWTTQEPGVLDEHKDGLQSSNHKAQTSAMNPFVRLQRLDEEMIERHLRGDLPLSIVIESQELGLKSSCAPTSAHSSSSSDDGDRPASLFGLPDNDSDTSENVDDNDHPLMDKPTTNVSSALKDSLLTRSDESRQEKSRSSRAAVLEDEERYSRFEDAMYKMAWMSPIPENEKRLVRPPELLPIRSPTSFSDTELATQKRPTDVQLTRPGSTAINADNNWQSEGPAQLIFANNLAPPHLGNTAADPQSTNLFVPDKSAQLSNQNRPHYAFPEFSTPSGQDRFHLPSMSPSSRAGPIYSFRPNILPDRFTMNLQSSSTLTYPSPVHFSNPPYFPEIATPNSQDRFQIFDVPPPPSPGGGQSNYATPSAYSECTTPSMQDRLQPSSSSKPHTYSFDPGIIQQPYGFGSATPNTQQSMHPPVMSSPSHQASSSFRPNLVLNSQEHYQHAIMPSSSPAQGGSGNNSSMQRLRMMLESPILSHPSQQTYGYNEAMQNSRFPVSSAHNSPKQAYHPGMPQPSPRGPTSARIPNMGNQYHLQGHQQHMPSTSFSSHQASYASNWLQQQQYMQRHSHTSVQSTSVVGHTNTIHYGMNQQHRFPASPMHSSQEHQFHPSNVIMPSDSFNAQMRQQHLSKSIRNPIVMQVNTIINQRIDYHINENIARPNMSSVNELNLRQNPHANLQARLDYYSNQNRMRAPFPHNVAQVRYGQNSADLSPLSAAHFQNGMQMAFANQHIQEHFACPAPPPYRPPQPPPITSVHAIRNTMGSADLNCISNPLLQELLDANPIYTALHKPPPHIRIIKRRGPRKTQTARLNRIRCKAGRVLKPIVTIRCSGRLVHIAVVSGRSAYQVPAKPAKVIKRKKRGRPPTKLRTKVLQSVYPYNALTNTRGRQRKHLKSEAKIPAKKSAEIDEAPEAPSGPPKSMPILTSSDLPDKNVFHAFTSKAAFPAKREPTARRSIGFRRGMPSTRGSGPTLNGGPTIRPPLPVIRGSLTRGGRRGRPLLSAKGSSRPSSVTGSLSGLQELKPQELTDKTTEWKRGRGRPPLNKNVTTRQQSIFESLALIRERKPEEIADENFGKLAEKSDDDDITLALKPLEEVDSEWFDQPSTLFGKPIPSDKIATMESGWIEEDDGVADDRQEESSVTTPSLIDETPEECGKEDANVTQNVAKKGYYWSKYKKRVTVPAPSFEDVELMHWKSDTLKTYKKSFKKVMGDNPSLPDEEILATLMNGEVQEVSAVIGTNKNNMMQAGPNRAAAKIGSATPQYAESILSVETEAPTDERVSPVPARSYSPMFSALMFDSSIEEDPLMLLMTPPKVIHKNQENVGSSDALDEDRPNFTLLESPEKNTFSSYITLDKASGINKPEMTSVLDSGTIDFDNYMPQTPSGPEMFDTWSEGIQNTPAFPDLSFPLHSPPESAVACDKEDESVRQSSDDAKLTNDGSAEKVAETENGSTSTSIHPKESSQGGLDHIAAIAEGLFKAQTAALDNSIEDEANAASETIEDDPEAHLVPLEAAVQELAMDKDVEVESHTQTSVENEDMPKLLTVTAVNVPNSNSAEIEQRPSENAELTQAQPSSNILVKDDAQPQKINSEDISDVIISKNLSDSRDDGSNAPTTKEKSINEAAADDSSLDLSQIRSFYIYDDSALPCTSTDAIKESVGSKPLNVLTYFVPPPSPAAILSSLAEYNIQETRYPVAHCSRPSDVPAKPMHLGGGAIVLKLQSSSVFDLKEFDGPLCSTGLSHWYQVLKIAEEAGYACSNKCNTKLDQLTKPLFHQGLCLEFYPQPPSPSQVQKWLEKKINEITCAQEKEQVNTMQVENSICMGESTVNKGLVKTTSLPIGDISPIALPRKLCDCDSVSGAILGSNSADSGRNIKKRRLSFSFERIDDQPELAKYGLELASPLENVPNLCKETPMGTRRLKRSFSDGDAMETEDALDNAESSSNQPSCESSLKKARWTCSTPQRAKMVNKAISRPRSPMLGSPGTSLRRQLLLQKIKTNLPPETSQLEGPSPKNIFGFKMSGETLQVAKSVHAYQYITLMSMELHVQTKGEMHPNPQSDAICAIFYHIHHDIPHSGEKNLKRKERLTGIIFADSNLPSNLNAGDSLEKTNLEDPLRVDTASTKTRQQLFHKHAQLLEKDVDVIFVKNEFLMIQEFVKVIQEHDPDILLGFEVQMLSWGFLMERSAVLGMKLCPLLSRVPDDSLNIFRPPQEGPGDTFVLNIVGRILLNVWQVLKSEIALSSYNFENLAFHILHKRIPLFSFCTLTRWYDQPGSLDRWRTLQHFLVRTKGNIQLLEQLNWIGKTSELARLFGIQFYEVLSRGSQFRVESMMLRLCRKNKYIAVSPSVQQRSSMQSPEHIPLVMEPVSKFYTNPVVVLDFQSLYPSIIIAYNYCFSTCLGRVENIGQVDACQFGCTSLKIPMGLYKKFQDKISVSPCGVSFVKAEVRKGILPKMLEEILASRIMVKTAMKQYKDDKGLHRMLDARQLGLKLISNVTYGYTAANFSGRMPCVEIADSVVSKGRETLERAISLINNTGKWNAKVVYGDTDSLFVLLEGRSKEQAFGIGSEIVQAVNADNPKPVKLKLEKVYLPCVLETKKRYVGYMYETPNQISPVYDAKGIETVRRDGCPAVAKILEKSIRILFTTHDVSQVKAYVQHQFHKLIVGRSGLDNYVFTREYHGRNGYHQENHAPAYKIACQLLQRDPRAEPRIGERVPYVVTYGSPGAILLDLICHPHEVMTNSSLRLNAKYYISNAIIPAVDRVFSLLGANVRQWYDTLPRSMRLALPTENSSRDGSTLLRHFQATTCPVCEVAARCGICPECLGDPPKVVIVLTDRIREWERRYHQISKVCQDCTGCSDERKSCISLDCPILFRLAQSKKDLDQAPYLRGLITKASLNW